MTLLDWIKATLPNGGMVLSNDTEIRIALKNNAIIQCADAETFDIWAHRKQAQPGAIVLDINSLPAETEHQTLLAQLRDLSGQTIYVLELDETPLLNDQEYIALGYRLQTRNPPYSIYRFSLDNYKKTPDWLNSRHWANPERWNKDRW